MKKVIRKNIIEILYCISSGSCYTMHPLIYTNLVETLRIKMKFYPNKFCNKLQKINTKRKLFTVHFTNIPFLETSCIFAMF